jgi:hypothetical protein
VKRLERTGQAPSTSPGQSPASPSTATIVAAKGQSKARTSKKARVDSGDSSTRDLGSGEGTSSVPVNAQAILRTIESMKAAIRSLQQTIGVVEEDTSKPATSLPDMVAWEDAAPLLPPKEDCEIIIDTFFSDVRMTRVKLDVDAKLPTDVSHSTSERTRPTGRLLSSTNKTFGSDGEHYTPVEKCGEHSSR